MGWVDRSDEWGVDRSDEWVCLFLVILWAMKGCVDTYLRP